MARKLRRPSLGLTDFPWTASKDKDRAAMVEEANVWYRDVEEPSEQHRSASEDIGIPPSAASYDLAMFLRTTGPRGRDSVVAPTASRSKSLPRHLLEYWKPRSDDSETGKSTSRSRPQYTYQERLRAWVRESSDDADLPLPPLPRLPTRLPDSVVQKTTLGGNRYLELTVPQTSIRDADTSKGKSAAHTSIGPGAYDLDRLILHNVTSDELMDGWLADLEGGSDSRLEPLHETLGLTRASSTAGGRLSLLLPPTWSRDSVRTVIRMGQTSEPHESGERRNEAHIAHWASQGMANPLEVDDEGPSLSPTNAGEFSQAGFPRVGTILPSATTPEAHSKRVPATTGLSRALSAGDTPRKHAFYGSDASVASVQHFSAKSRADSGHGFSSAGPGRPNVDGMVSPRSSSLGDLSGRPIVVSNPGAMALADEASDQVLVRHARTLTPRRPLRPLDIRCANDVPPATWTMAPKYSPQARDFVMQEVESSERRKLQYSTRNALTYDRQPHCELCFAEQASSSRQTYAQDVQESRGCLDAHVHAQSALGRGDDRFLRQSQVPDPGGRKLNAVQKETLRWAVTERQWLSQGSEVASSSVVDLGSLSGGAESQTAGRRLRQAHSEELLSRFAKHGRTTRPQPDRTRRPRRCDTKLPHIATLSRSNSRSSPETVANAMYGGAPSPPPDKALPPLPVLPHSEHPGRRAERSRIGMPPQVDVSGVRTVPSPRATKTNQRTLHTVIQQSLQQYMGGCGFQSLGIHEALWPSDKSDKRFAELEMLEAQVYELQFKASQLSAMVVDVLSKQY